MHSSIKIINETRIFHKIILRCILHCSFLVTKQIPRQSCYVLRVYVLKIAFFLRVKNRHNWYSVVLRGAINQKREFPGEIP